MRRGGGGVFGVMVMGQRIGLQLAPVRDDIGPFAVDLEPRERFREHRAMEQTALCADRGLHVEQPRLQRDDVLQALEVSPCNRQHTQLDAAFERIG